MSNKSIKKSQELPVNIIVMAIIGIIIFGLGIGLFGSISNNSSREVERLNKRISTELDELACRGEDYLCVPQEYRVRRGKSNVFEIFITNKAQSKKTFKLQIGKVTEKEDPNIEINVEKTGCGEITLLFPKNKNTLELGDGKSAKVPFTVRAKKAKSKCQFIIPAYLMEGTSQVGVVPLIVDII